MVLRKTKDENLIYYTSLFRSKNGGSLGARAYLDAFSCLYEDLALLYPNHKIWILVI